MNLKDVLLSLPQDFLKFSGTANRSEFIWKSIILILLAAVFPMVWFQLLGMLGAGRLSFSTGLKLYTGGIAVFEIAIATILIPLTMRRFKDTGISVLPLFAAIALSAMLFMVPTGIFFAGMIQFAVFLFCALVPTRVSAIHAQASAHEQSESKSETKTA